MSCSLGYTMRELGSRILEGNESMLHKGKAHTYGLDGPFGVAYGASIVWFVTTLAVALPTYAAGEPIALVWAIGGVGVSWVLGLIAFAHRPAAWRWWAAESAVLLLLAIVLLCEMR